MKVIGICSSPRNGNSERMLAAAIKGCKESGAETELILLRTLKFSGCCGMDSCFHDAKCYMHDRLTAVLAAIEKADALILASPSYFNNVTGLMKNFMDRSNPYCKNKKWKRKKAIVMAVGGANMRSVKRCEAVMKDFCKIHVIMVFGSVCTVAEKIGKAEGKGSLLRKCHNLGAKFVKNMEYL